MRFYKPESLKDVSSYKSEIGLLTNLTRMTVFSTNVVIYSLARPVHRKFVVLFNLLRMLSVPKNRVT